MRQFTFLKGAAKFNIFCAVIMMLVLGFIGTIATFMKFGEVETLKPMFDLFGEGSSKMAMTFLHQISDLRLSRGTLREMGIHLRGLGRVINYFTIAEWLMILGFGVFGWAVFINIYASVNLIKRINMESAGIKKVSRIKMFLTCVLSMPIAPLAGFIMLFGTLFSKRVETTKQTNSSW